MEKEKMRVTPITAEEVKKRELRAYRHFESLQSRFLPNIHPDLIKIIGSTTYWINSIK